jgi:hypothetical protein
MKCKRCGIEWEEWALDKWARGQVAAFLSGEGCPECLGPEEWEEKAHVDSASPEIDKECLESLKEKEEKEPSISPEDHEERIPGLAIAGYVLGILEIVGGVTMCFKLWPGVPEPGYRWLFTAYIPALTWLAAGIISGFFFFAISAVLTHLDSIRRSLQTLKRYAKLPRD